MADLLNVLAQDCLYNGSGQKIAKGIFTIVPTDDQDREIPVRIGTAGGQVFPITGPVEIINGSLQSTVQFPNPATSNPTNVRARITISDTSSWRASSRVLRNVLMVDNGSGNWNLASYTTGLVVSDSPMLVNGKSAYEVAVDTGFEGTEAEWVAGLAQQAADLSVAEFQVVRQYVAANSSLQTVGSTGGSVTGNLPDNYLAELTPQVTTAGSLDSITINVSRYVAGGSIIIVIYRETTEGGGPGSQTVVATFTVPVPGTGIHTLRSGTDFEPIQVAAGHRIGFHGANVGVGYSSGGEGNLTPNGSGDWLTVGGVSGWANNTFHVEFSFGIRSFAAPLTTEDITPVQADASTALAIAQFPTSMMSVGRTGLPSALTLPSNYYAELIGKLAGGTLDSITCKVASLAQGGVFTVLLSEEVYAGYPGAQVLRDKFTLTPTATGVQTFVVGRDFAPRAVGAGWRVGVICSGGALLAYGAGGLDNCYTWNGNGDPATIGATSYWADAANHIELLVQVRTPALPQTGLQRLTHGDELKQFGDSLSAGGTLGNPSTERYGALIAADTGLQVYTRAIGGDQAADIWSRQLQPNLAADSPTLSNPALYTVMIGTNDVNHNNVGAYEAVYKACMGGFLAWVGIPREYKVLPGDAALVSQAGSANPAAYGSETRASCARMTAAGTLRATITTYGKPLCVWHFVDDNNAGSFTVSIDGGSPSGPYSCQTTPAIATANGSTASVVLTDRIVLPAGTHTVDFVWVSGVVGIVGCGTSPVAGYYNQPVVALGQIPYENQGSTYGASHLGATLTYNKDLVETITPLQADGLDIRLVPILQWVPGSANFYNDDLHWNATAHKLAAIAYEAALQVVPKTRFLYDSNGVRYRLSVSTSGVVSGVVV